MRIRTPCPPMTTMMGKIASPPCAITIDATTTDVQ